MSFRRYASLCLALALATPAIAQDKTKTEKKPATKPAAKSAKPAKDVPDEWLAPMDYGPALMTSVARSGKPYKNEPFEAPNVPKFPIDVIPDMAAVKGIVISLGPKDANGKPAATVVFDTDRLAMSSGWTGGWLDLTGTMLTNRKGTSLATIQGTEQFRVAGAGVANPADGSWKAAAASGEAAGSSVGSFLGHIINGDRVILRYRVGGAELRESPGYEGGLFTRTLQSVGGSGETKIALADIAGVQPKQAGDSSQLLTVVKDGKWNGWMVVGSQTQAKLGYEKDRVVLTLPKTEGNAAVTVGFLSGPAADADALLAKLKACKPGVVFNQEHLASSPRWKPLTTTGQLGDAPGSPVKKGADPAFVLDNLTLPDKNPYNSWFRLGGVDFFPDGRAAICTLNGDVWIVSGIDAGLSKLTWTRHATGLYQPLGVKVVDSKVYVRGRDQITRLIDSNNDGEADSYENFSSEGVTHPSYHGLVFDLQTDDAGNFYYARGGIGMNPEIGHGQLTQLSKDGKKAINLASGLRAPNGLGVVRGKWVTVSDNQGNWIPTSRINLIDPNKPGGFFGFLPHHHLPILPEKATEPLVWIPHALDTSSGGQCEIPAGSWGDYSRQWIHTSYGTACTMLLLPDDAAPADTLPKQAAVVRLPMDFATGVMRPRFNPKDSQLYVAGVGGGWQSKGTADGGLYRIRHTGKPGHLPAKFAVVPDGIRLTFAVALDKKEAADPENYAVEQWNYKWSEKYGSPDFSARTPNKAGHDEVEVKSVLVSEDGKTVTLKLTDFAPVQQMLIECNLVAADGADIEAKVYATVNEVPKK